MDGLGAPRGRREKTTAERRPQGRRAEARCVQRLLVAFTSVVEHRGNQLGILSLALAKVLSPALSKAATAVDSAAVANTVPSHESSLGKWRTLQVKLLVLLALRPRCKFRQLWSSR